jgi:hypothetical protein
MKFTPFRVLLFVFAIAGLWSCGNSSKENSSDEFNKAEESLKDQVEDLVYNLPSPHEIPYLLETTGAEFNQGLVNDNKKVDQYLTRSEKAAMNLGVYATDIGYLSSYDKTQDAIDYLNASKKLADNLGILGAFDVTILERFEANIGNKDSLANLLDKTISETDAYLQDNSRDKLAALMLAGSAIEGLYISTGVIKSYPKDLLPDDARNLVLTPLIRVILEQEKSVSELLKMMSKQEQTEPVTTMVADLTTLEASYRSLNIDEQLKNNQGNLVLTDKNLADITSIVEKMRKSIVE